jgi:hypothetical protein
MSQQGGTDDLQRWLGIVRECVLKAKKVIQK